MGQILRRYGVRFFAIALMSITFFAFSASAEDSFRDIKPLHKHYEAIEFLHDNGIIEGQGNSDVFDASGNLNRAEFSAVLVRLLGVEPQMRDYKQCFPDVRNQWFAPYVCYAKEQELMQGFQEGELAGQFGPDQPLTYGQLTTVLSRLAGWNITFGDGDEWWEPHFYYAESRNIIENKLFGDSARRDVMAEIILRTIALNTLDSATYTPEVIDDFLEYVDTTDTFSVSDVFELEGASGIDGEKFSLGSGIEIQFSDLEKNTLIANGADEYEVQFRLTQNQVALQKRDLIVRLENIGPEFTEQGFSVSPNIRYTELGSGFYTANASSTRSGRYNLVVHDVETNAKARKQLQFLPGTPAHFEILDSERTATQDYSLGIKHYHIAVMDEFMNIIPNSVFSGSATRGDIVFSYHEDGSATASVYANAYGENTTEINGSASGQIFTLEQENTFFPLGLEHQHGYSAQSNREIDLPIRLFIPNYANLFGEVSAEITIPQSLQVIEGSLNTEVFEGELSLSPQKDQDVTLSISGKIVSPPESRFEKTIGVITVQSPSYQEHSITGSLELFAQDTSILSALVPEEGAVKMPGDRVVLPSSHVFATLRGKNEKRVCLDILVHPDVSVSDAQISDDVAISRDIFSQNAHGNQCSHFLGMDYTVTRFTQDQWNNTFGTAEDETAQYPNPENVLQWHIRSAEHNASLTTDSDETDSETQNEAESEENTNPPALHAVSRKQCTPVFYAPLHTSGHSIRTEQLQEPYGDDDTAWGINSFIVIDHEQDHDERTLARQLAYHLSQNSLPGPINGGKYGAGHQGNLMSLADLNTSGNPLGEKSGNHISQNQCTLINWSHWRFNVYPKQDPTI